MIRPARPDEQVRLGQLMVRVYAKLEGFPSPNEQPAYYDMLANVGRFTERPDTEVLVSVADDGAVQGGLVYFGDMAQYGAGGTATRETNASGFRFLAVDPEARGAGVGKALTEACLERAKARGHDQVVIHTTEPMRMAWRMYQRMGFVRSPDLDFSQEGFPVFGFRLHL